MGGIRVRNKETENKACPAEQDAATGDHECSSKDDRRQQAENQEISCANIDIALTQHLLERGDAFGAAQEGIESRDPAHHFVAEKGDVDRRLGGFLRR